MDVVILAGGSCPDDLTAETGCTRRSDLRFGSRTILEITVEAVQDCATGMLVVVGNEAPGAVSVRSGETFLESVRTGLERSSGERTLIVAADSPFLTREGVNDFVAHVPRSTVFAWPIVRAEACERTYPGMKRTTLRVREGRFTGGNMALVRRAEFIAVYPQLERAYANRKRPLRLALQVGISTLFRVGVGQLIPSTLPVRALEERVSRFLGVEARAILSEHPEIGADVDNLAQYRQAKGVFGN